MDEFLENIADAFERDIASVRMDDRFRDYEQWDSVSLLSLIAMLEDEYGVVIPRELFEDMHTLEEMYDFIQSKK